MNQLLKIIIRKNIFTKNVNSNLAEQRTLFVWSHQQAKMRFSCYTVSTNLTCPQNNHIVDFCRTYTKKNGENENDNYSSIIPLPKTLHRLRKKKIRTAPDDQQRRLQKGVENVLENKRVALTTTRRRIQEKGKLIMQDIKETKHKMKEKLDEVIEKENVYTIPNLLCIARIGLSPFLGYLIILEKFECALVFVFLSGITDWIDGWIARNYSSQSSKIGSFLDPMADKVLIGTLFLSLTYVNLIPVSLTVLIIGRDVLLIISGFVIRYKSLPYPRTISRYFDVTYATAQLAPTFISKVNTGIQLILVGSTVAAPVLGYVNHLFLQLMWYVTATSTLVSASSYIFSKETYRYFGSKKKSKYEKEINR